MKFNVSSIGEWQKSRERLGAKLGQDLKELEATIKVDMEWCRKWGAKAAFATKVKSRLKRVEKDKVRVQKLKSMIRGLPADEVLSSKKGEDEELSDGMLPLADMGNVSLRLPEPPLKWARLKDGVLLGLRDVDISYGPEKPVILKDVRIQLGANSRVALRGPNGAGKSTLLRTLYGAMDFQAGERKVGEGSLGTASVGLFTQDLAQDLPSDITPVEYVLSSGGSEEETRATLGALGLKSSQHKAKIGSLSGGEKARVALALFATTPTDVLLLDEPTNHLDRVAVTALASGLRTHAGAVLVSTHDEAFIDALQVTDEAIITIAHDGAPGTLAMASDAKKL